MRRRFLLVLLFAGFGLTAFAQAPASNAMGPDWQPALEGKALVQALQGGGYVLYIRHTATDFGQNDTAMTSFEDCSRQRNLTDAGRADARAIGAALRTLKIPIGSVLASPYCRTLETGRLVFGSATISPGMRGGPAQPASQARYAELRATLSTPVSGQTNTAISSHGNPFYGVAGPPYLAEGEIAVVKPEGNGRFTIVARVPVRGFPELAALR